MARARRSKAKDPDGFDLDGREVRKLLTWAMGRGASFAEIFHESGRSNRILMEEDRIKQSGGGVRRGIGIRVIHGDRTGYAHTDDLSMASLEEAARAAAHIADGPRGDRPRPVKIGRIPRRYPIDRPAVEASLDEKFKLIDRANAAAHRVDDRIRQVQIAFEENERHVTVINSEGLRVDDRLPMVTFRVNTIVDTEAGPQSGGYSGGGRVGMEFFRGGRPEHIAVTAAEQAVLMSGARSAPAGRMPVVLAPGDSGVLLHEAVGHGLEADFNRKGSSNYSGMIGKRVASRLCTIVDDATMLHNRGSLDVDDEGRVPGKTTLIEGGILRQYLQDRVSAEVMGLEPTGNGRRQSYAHLPMPRMTNTYMLAGDSDPTEILESVSRGIYAVRFGGGQVDISNGEFTFNIVEGWLIENGRLVHPIKGAQLIGNGPDVLRKVSMVGNDLEISEVTWTCGKGGQMVPVGVGMPTCKVSAITVGGTE